MSAATTNPAALDALRIDVDGTIHKVTLTPNEDGSYLRDFQEQVGGSVDIVALSDHMDMWLNDEGLVIGLPINPVATYIAAHHGLIWQPYAGPALITGGADDQGESLPLSAEAEAAIRILARMAGGAA